MAIHSAAILLDGHNDLPWNLRAEDALGSPRYDLRQRLDHDHTDIPRLRAGGVKAQFWSVYVPANLARRGGAARTTLEQIDLVHRMIALHPEAFELALTAGDVERIARAGKIASLIGIEGGHSIEGSLGTLRMMHRLGARYMTLTHNDTLDWADSATDAARHGGLAPFGVEVVREMNRLGMLVDISHVSAETMHDVLDVSRAPVIASHSSAFALAPHPRNVPDDVLERLKKNGGVVMVNFYSGFVHPAAASVLVENQGAFRKLREEHASDDAAFRKAVRELRSAHPIPRATLAQVLDHIDHIARKAGVEHVGLGSDFDGMDSTPEGLEDVSCFPRITQGLLDRGTTEDAIKGILGGNVLRALRQAEVTAAAIEKEARAPPEKPAGR
jgi:membrane dipeptidase